MLTRPATTLDPLVQHLRTLAETKPDLREASEIYAALLPLLRDRVQLACPVAMTPAEARMKLERGSFLLEGEELGFDEWSARDLLIQLARSIESVPDHMDKSEHWVWIRVERRRKPRSEGPSEPSDQDLLRATSARQIRLLLERGDLEAGVLLARAAAGDQSFIIALANDLNLDAGILWTLSRYALIPALYAWRSQLSPLAGKQSWEKDYCYICGADASLAELVGNQQERRLRCVRCGADWNVRRLVCVHCGNEDHRTLSYLYPDDMREQYQIQVCNQCKRHLKVIASFESIPPEQVIVQDLATLHLDLIAQQHGYQ